MDFSRWIVGYTSSRSFNEGTGLGHEGLNRWEGSIKTQEFDLYSLPRFVLRTVEEERKIFILVTLNRGKITRVVESESLNWNLDGLKNNFLSFTF